MQDSRLEDSRLEGLSQDWGLGTDDPVPPANPVILSHSRFLELTWIWLGLYCLGMLKNVLLIRVLGLALAFSFIAMSVSSSLAAEAPYRHVVFFKFKDSATPEQVAGIEQAFIELSRKVETVTGFEWGTNVSPEGLNQEFTHCFLVTFKDRAGLDVYLPHPAHEAFVAQLKPLLDKVCVLDYVAK